MAHVASTNRSASPNPSRSQSPSPRAANGSKVVKKVPWVNPNKHAVPSSPSEIHQRSLTSKGGRGSLSPRASFEHNENERDLNGSKMNKARSPAAAAALKGTKNFMSPTISASSKVTAASPRRRILSERNDDTRSSLSSLYDSFDFTEFLENDAKSVAGTGSHVTMDNPKILKASSPKKVESNGAGLSLPYENFYHQESLSSLPKIFQKPAESSPEVSVTHCSSTIDSLDEDSAPPSYDPKTNYLSPRPRFLHYKPKPRIEHYLIEGEGFSGPIDGGQLEERFSSESSEAASEQAEEIQFSAERTVGEDDSCPSEVENGEIGRQEQAHDSEHRHDDIIILKQAPKYDSEPRHDDIIILKQAPKSHFFTRTKYMKFLLMVVVASLFVSAIDTPSQEIYSLSSLKHEPIMNLPTSALQLLDEPYMRYSFDGLRDHASLKFDKLASKFRDLSISSVARFHMSIASIFVPREELGFYLNNTAVTEVEEAKNLDKLEHEEEQRLVPDSTDVRDLSISSVARFHMLIASIFVPREELGFYLNNTAVTEVEEAKNLDKLEHEEEQRLVPDSTDVQAERSYIHDIVEIIEAEVDGMKQEEEQRLLPDFPVEADKNCSGGFVETIETETSELGVAADFPVKQAIFDVTKDGIADFSEDRAHLDLQLGGTEDEIMEEVQTEISPLLDQPNGEELRSYIPMKTSEEAEEEPQAENILSQSNFEVHTDAKRDYAIFDVTKDGIADFSEDRAHLDLQLGGTEDEIMEEVQTEISPLLDQPNGEELRSYIPMKTSEEAEEEPQAENFLSQSNFEVHTDAKRDYDNSYASQIFHSADFGLVVEFPWQTLWGIFSVALALAAISISLRVSRNHTPSPASYVLSSPSNVMSEPMSPKHMHLQNPSQSCLPEAETMDSGPSEASSSLQKSFSFGQRRARSGVEQDTLSHERDLRRDSVASSSSYGSFTTYERLSAKKGYRGDDEALTPVRRSSRLRSQLTSP